MPIYEYECCKCGKIVEAWQSLSDKPVADCPDCSGDMKKLISKSSFQLKGGGWYSDGYSSTSPKSSCADKGCDKSASEGSSSSGVKDKAACGSAE